MNAPEMRTLQDYQLEVTRTMTGEAPKLSGLETLLVWDALGLAGETGEVCDRLKKAIFHGQGLTEQAEADLVKELGDVEWYLTSLITHLQETLQRVCQLNAEKLRARYPNGWEPSRSHKPGERPAEDR